MRLIKLVIALILLSTQAWSATYYIDYDSGDDSNNGTSTSTPWQYAPQMPGFSGSYSPSGDTFVFKGGVTWPLTGPDTVDDGGTNDDCFPLTPSANSQTFTGGQLEGTPWGAGKPVFDGEAGVDTGTGIISLSTSRASLTINGLKLINVGTSGATNQGRAIHINPIGESLVISNCEMIPYANHGIVLTYDGSAGNITTGPHIYNNSISHATNSIEINEPDSDSNVCSALYIHDNNIFDPGSQLVGGDHGDGIHVTDTGTDSVYSFDDVRIYNNSFYGDWGGSDASTSNTAQIYIEGCCTNTLVYNNSHTFSNTDNPRTGAYLFSPGFIVVGGGTVEIYNNSMCASNRTNTGSDGVFSCIRATDTTSVVIKGNACIDARFGLSTKDNSSLTSDYNYLTARSGDGYWGNPGDGDFDTLAAWQTATSQDANSADADPLFSSTSNLILQSGSGAIDFFPTAQAPTGDFTVDINGNSRPQNSAWDAGAYEFTGTAGGQSLTIGAGSQSISIGSGSQSVTW